MSKATKHAKRKSIRRKLRHVKNQRINEYTRTMATAGTDPNSANHELLVSQSLRMINPSIIMNRKVAILKKNNQPTIRFSDFGILFTVLFRQFHKTIPQLQADFLAFLQVK